MLNIIDIASHQAGMNLEAMFRLNPVLDGVIVKTTGGNYYVNPYADPWIQWLRQQGKPWGFYHYLTEDGIRITAKQEAEFWLTHAGNYFGEGTAWLDYEDKTAIALGPDFVHEVLTEIYQRTGVKAGVYFSWGLKEWQDFSAIAKDGYPFWCARYANELFTGWQTNPWQSFSPSPWARMTMLQYSSKGRIPGWGKNLDLNLFFGSYSEWLALAGADKPADQPLREADPEIVAAVLRDEYGIDPVRSEKLRKAGYDPDSVQQKINDLYALADRLRPQIADELPYLDSLCHILRG